MRSFFKQSEADSSEVLSSRLFDQRTFYDAFLSDLRHARTRVVIESPFITTKRLDALMPTLMSLRRRGVRIVVNTKPLDEHNDTLRHQADEAIALLQTNGIKVLMTVGHHRKLAIIDDNILWEGRHS